MISIKIEIKSWKKILLFCLVLGVIAAGAYWTTRWVIPTHDFEITDDLGGNIFPSAILSTATTDAMIIKPTLKNYLGNPKSGLALKINSRRKTAEFRLPLPKRLFTAPRSRNSYFRKKVPNIPSIRTSSGTMKSCATTNRPHQST